MNWVISKSGIGIVALLIISFFVLLQVGVFGETTIGVTLKSNQSLEEGLIAHYTFDGEYEQGTYEFGTNGSTTTDPSFTYDFVNDMTEYEGYLYYVGETESNISNNGHFYVMKVDPVTGGLEWASSTNITSDRDMGLGITVADDFVYVTGRCEGCGSKGAEAIHTIKMSATDGSYVWSTTTDPTANDDEGHEIVVLGEYVYVVATCDGCGAKGGLAQYLVKMTKSDGRFVQSTTTDWTTNSDEYDAITTDGDLLYVIGSCQACNGVSGFGTTNFAINPDTLSMVWATTTDPTGSADTSQDGIYADGSLFVTGSCDSFGDCGGLNGDDVIYTYKLRASDGLLLWATTTDPSSGADSGVGITYDGTDVYVGGVCKDCSTANANYIVKIDGSDGSFLWASTTHISTGNEGLDILQYYDGTLYAPMDCETGCGPTGGASIVTMAIDPATGNLKSTTTSSDSIQPIGDIMPTSGTIGQGIELDGDGDYIRDQRSSVDTFTYAGWVKANPGSETFIVLGGESAFSPGLAIARVSGDDRVEIVRANAGTIISHNVGTSFFQTDTWNHVAGSYDHSTGDFAVYVNGSLATTGTNMATSWTHGDLVVGAYRLSSDPSARNYFEGELDDVRLYNRVLGAAEISRLYELGATTKLNLTLDTNPDLKRGLELHYTFDATDLDLSSSTAEVLDRSGNGRNANWRSHSSTTVPGVIGQAVYLDGSDNNTIALSEFTNSEGVGAMTLSLWVSPDILQNSGNSPQVFMSKDRSGFPQWNISRTGSGNPNHFSFEIGTSTDNKFTAEGPQVMLDDGWYHVVAMYNDPDMSVYLNSDLVATGTAGGNIRDDYNHEVCIGGESNASGFCINGETAAKFDDVRYYSRALSESEIDRLYELGATTKVNQTIDTNPDLKNGLINHYTFDGAATYNVFENKAATTANDAYMFENAVQATTTRPGKIGQGIFLDGANLSAITTNSYNNMGEFTVCTWFNLDSLENDDSDVEIMFLEKGWQFFKDTNDRFYLDVPTSSSFVRVISQTVMRAGKWYHACARFFGVGTAPDMFVNGVEDESSSQVGSGSLSDNSAIDLTIGSSINEFSSNLPGVMDEIRIYDRALSDAEILRLYQLGN